VLLKMKKIFQTLKTPLSVKHQRNVSNTQNGIQCARGSRKYMLERKKPQIENLSKVSNKVNMPKFIQIPTRNFKSPYSIYPAHQLRTMKKEVRKYIRKTQIQQIAILRYMEKIRKKDMTREARTENLDISVSIYQDASSAERYAYKWMNQIDQAIEEKDGVENFFNFVSNSNKK